MGLPWQGRLVHWHSPTPLLMLPHLHTGDIGRAHQPKSTVSPNNGAMPDMYSANAATDAAKRLADALVNPALAAPFDRFYAQTMDAIQQLARIFAATGAPTPTTTSPPRRTCATIQLPMLHCNTDHQGPLRVPHTVPPCRPPMPPPDPLPRVDPPPHTTHPTGTPCALAHRPTKQWIL